MGNFHCIPSGCAEVVYQEYEGNKVRWRYGNESWQEIFGNDYSLEIIQDLTQNTQYQAVYRKPIISNGCLQGWEATEYTSSIPGILNGIQSYILTINNADFLGYTHCWQ